MRRLNVYQDNVFLGCLEVFVTMLFCLLSFGIIGMDRLKKSLSAVE